MGHSKIIIKEIIEDQQPSSTYFICLHGFLLPIFVSTYFGKETFGLFIDRKFLIK